MKLLRMKPGHGEIVLAEGDVEVPEQERELIEAFRRELDAGMWAAVPTDSPGGRREAELVKSFDEVPARRRARDLLPARRRRRARRRSLAPWRSRWAPPRSCSWCCSGSSLRPTLKRALARGRLIWTQRRRALGAGRL